ncbi:hypothetical protein IAT38_007860 [Cryptococcus sp. DSM 104549]
MAPSPTPSHTHSPSSSSTSSSAESHDFQRTLYDPTVPIPHSSCVVDPEMVEVPIPRSPTPTIVLGNHPARSASRASRASHASVDPETQTAAWVKPSVKAVIKAHPKNTLYLVGLVAGLVGMTVGWTFFLMHQAEIGQSKDDGGDTEGTGQDGMGAIRGGGSNGLSPIVLVVDAVFIIAIVLAVALLSRQIFFIYHLFLPPRAPDSPPSASSFLPPWLLPRLPTYVDAVGGRPDATGDVEDRWIVGESLPVYGNTRGSKLLLRSESRGGAVTAWEAGRGAGAGAGAVSPLRLGTTDAPVSYTQSQVTAATTRSGLTEDEASIERARAVEREAERQRVEQSGMGAGDEKSRYIMEGV